jgi:hypothetical protein
MPAPLLKNRIVEAQVGLGEPSLAPIDMRHCFVGAAMKKLEGRIENPYTRSEVVQGHVAKLPAGNV